MTKSHPNLKFFTEIGFGNISFILTEIEKGQRERRRRGCIRFRVTEIYLRVWLGYKVFILSTRDGCKRAVKSQRKFKLVLGWSGHL